MEESKTTSIKSVSIKYGLISALIGIIFFVIIDFAGMAGNQAMSFVGLLFTAVIMYLAHQEYKKEGDGFMSYGQGLGIGTLLSVISAVISSAFVFIYVKFVNPNYLDIIREQQVMTLEEQGLSDAELEQAMSVTEQFTTPMALFLFGVFLGIFFGFLIALVVSAITKKSRPEFS